MSYSSFKLKNYIQNIGAFYAIASAITYGLVGFFGISVIKSGLSISCMLFWRFSIASLILLIFNYSKTKSNQQSITIDRSSIASIIFFSGSSILFFISSLYIGTGLAMVIFFTYPIFVILLSIVIYKQQISKKYFISFVLIILGIILLNISEEIKFELYGIFIGILSAFLYGFYMILSQKQSKGIHPMDSTITLCIGCSLVCLATSLIDGSFQFPTGFNTFFDIFILAVICTVVPIWLLLKSLETITATKASILSACEPVVVLIIGYFFLNEDLNTYQILGAMVIITGALVVNSDKQIAPSHK